MDLSPEEIRALGVLVEKALATPQAYPLTLNALRVACNQSTNRDPVVDYGEHEVEAAARSLRARGLTRVVHSTSNRAAKHRHVLDEVWDLDEAEQAVLAVLALRGPQTLGELKARTERLHRFDDLAEVEAVLDRLSRAEPEPLARRLDRRPGQKDARYVALLGDSSRPSPASPASASAASGVPPQPEREAPGDERGGSALGGPTLDALTIGGARSVELESSASLPDRVAELEQQMAVLRAELASVRALLDDVLG